MKSKIRKFYRLEVQDKPDLDCWDAIDWTSTIKEMLAKIADRKQWSNKKVRVIKCSEQTVYAE